MFEFLLKASIKRPVLLAVATLLFVVLAIDALQLVRPSALSAIACTPTLLQQRPTTTQLLEIHRSTIIREAAANDLPAALVAAVIVDHQASLTPLRTFTDCAGSAIGANLSLGPAQIRLSTAADVDGLQLASMSAGEYRKLRARLLNPATNIAYEARELRALLERPSRFPGVSASTLLHDPAAMALLVTEYREGRKSTPINESRRAIRAFSTLARMQGDPFTDFYTSTQEQADAHNAISHYLEYINCESGIFNGKACVSWLQSQANLGRGG